MGIQFSNNIALFSIACSKLKINKSCKFKHLFESLIFNETAKESESFNTSSSQVNLCLSVLLKSSVIFLILSFVVFLSMNTKAYAAPLPPLLPGACGAVIADSWVVPEHIGTNETGSTFYSDNTYFYRDDDDDINDNPRLDPPANPHLSQYYSINQATGELTFDDALNAQQTFPRIISNVDDITFLERATGARTEIWSLAIRVDGIPGSAQSVVLNTNIEHEFVTYWVTDENGNVFHSLDRTTTNEGGWHRGYNPSIGGDGSLVPINFTMPANNTIAYVNVAIIDPNERWGTSLTISQSCGPLLDIEKTNNSTSDYIDGDGSGDLSVGDTVTYTYTVTNTGGDPLTGVTANDDLLGPITLSNTSIPIGGSVSGTLTYVLDTGDVGNDIVNIATATSTQTGTYAPTDTNTIPPISYNANISVTKDLVTTGPYTSGQTVTYNITVGNSATAQGPATNVVVEDIPTNLTITSVSSTNCSSLPCTIPSLAVGASEVITVQAIVP